MNHYHLLYVPEDTGDKIIGVVNDINLPLSIHNHPEAVILELDAETSDEVMDELTLLGF